MIQDSTYKSKTQDHTWNYHWPAVQVILSTTVILLMNRTMPVETSAHSARRELYT